MQNTAPDYIKTDDNSPSEDTPRRAYPPNHSSNRPALSIVPADRAESAIGSSADSRAEHRRFPSSVSIPTPEIIHALEDWIADGKFQRLSKRTIEQRRFIADKLRWFLESNLHRECGDRELRRFLTYISRAHEDKDGRWGNRNPQSYRPVSSGTLRDYHHVLSAFGAWLVAEDLAESSIMARVPRIKHNPDQIQPFTEKEVAAIRYAAQRSDMPARDEAIILFLFDTGVRVSEICGLCMGDVDFVGRKALILMGKGAKSRTVYFGRKTLQAMKKHFRQEELLPDDPFFASRRGGKAGDALTRSGMLQLIKRLGRSAGIQTTRCSPHTFRHTFAIEFLRAGGNVATLQQILGHTTLAMSMRYVKLAEADIENQHRQFSPADRLR